MDTVPVVKRLFFLLLCCSESLGKQSKPLVLSGVVGKSLLGLCWFEEGSGVSA